MSRGKDTFLSKIKPYVKCPFFGKNKVECPEAQNNVKINHQSILTDKDIISISEPIITQSISPMSPLGIPSENDLQEKAEASEKQPLTIKHQESDSVENVSNIYEELDIHGKIFDQMEKEETLNKVESLPNEIGQIISLDISLENNLLKKALEPVNQVGTSENLLKNQCEDGDLFKTDSNHYEELDKHTNHYDNLLFKQSKKESAEIIKQDSFIFGEMMVSRYLVVQCISLLSEVLEACEGSGNCKQQNTYKCNEEIERKIKFCINILNSFDLHYYEDGKLSFDSSAEFSKKEFKNQEEKENKECFVKSSSSLKSSASKNVLSPYLRDKIKDFLMDYDLSQETSKTDEHHYEVLKLTPTEDLVYAHTKLCSRKQASNLTLFPGNIAGSSSNYQNLAHFVGLHITDALFSHSYTCFDLKENKFNIDLQPKLTCKPQCQNSHPKQSHKNPIQKKYSETLEDDNWLSQKGLEENMDCFKKNMLCNLKDIYEEEIVQCEICKPIHICEDPALLMLPKEDAQLRVAKWLMSNDNYRLMKVYSRLENYKGSENQYEETGSSKSYNKLNPETTQL